jgi:signal transduction histidine kinase
MRIEQSSLLRLDLAADAAAELHDTALNQLALIASAPPGPLSAKNRERIQRDLAAWGRDRTAALERDAAHAKTVDALWQHSELASGVEQARDVGLEVEVSGDRGVIGRLSAQSARAVALAVRQCLVNVLRHSGQFSAQLTLSSTADDVSVMVLDAGRGFDESATTADRLGLQHAIRDRIERVGGSVVVFSAPGEGTSISMVVPTADADRTDSAKGPA